MVTAEEQVILKKIRWNSMSNSNVMLKYTDCEKILSILTTVISETKPNVSDVSEIYDIVSKEMRNVVLTELTEEAERLRFYK